MSKYNDPTGGTPSTIGVQVRTDHLLKQALVEARRKQVFLQTADVKTMPKNMGKSMKQYFYVPVLDDRNLSTEGIGPDGNTPTPLPNGATGALYGGSKDIGTISSRLPTLGEEGGRVNRIGFTRELREGTIEKFGVFMDYTQDALDFDTDSELYSHLYTELMNAASELTEDMLQLDLLNNAHDNYTGVADAISKVVQPVEYTDLLRLSIELDDNRTPRQSKIITGTRNIDTRVVAGVRYIYCGTEMIPTLKRMVDLHGKPAFIPVEHYAAGTQLAMNEIGAIDQFRFIVHPEMQHHASAGGLELDAVLPKSYGGDDNLGSAASMYVSTDTNKLDVFPLLFIGEGSYSTIGFQTNGQTVKFKIVNKKPGAESADVHNDPYGEKGFVSLKFFYGFLLQRPERLQVLWSTAFI